MIKSIDIRGFQSHEDTYLEFHEGVNVIVGPSDSGKTAIIRALRWIRENRPGGTSFISTWSKTSVVLLDLMEQICIGRKKTEEGENAYYIVDENDKETKFLAFGQSVPEEISKLLNISDTNIQHQLDPPFLLSSSPGEVARYLNRVVKLDEIDTSLYNIAQKIRLENKDLAVEETVKERLEKSLEEGFYWLTDAEDGLKRLENIQGYITDTNHRVNKITELIDDINKHNEKLKKIRLLASAKPEVERLIKLDTEIDSLDRQWDEINGSLEAIKGWESRLKNLKGITQYGQEIDRLIKLDSECQELDLEFFKLQKAVKLIKDKEALLKTKIIEKELLEKEYHRLMPDICPLCGK